LEQLDLVPALLEQGRDVLHGSLLSAERPIAVVQQQNTGARRSPSRGIRHCPTENSASRSWREYASNATIVCVRSTPRSRESRSVTTCASWSGSRRRRIATKSHSPVTEYA